jgi:Tfp pilus assembly protein PilF/arylsulfatase A-like enzyme
MRLDDIRRSRIPLSIALVVVSCWLLCGVRRTAGDDRVAVLDSRLGLVAPRVLAAGWHLAPPGLLRISTYPVRPATLSIAAGGAADPLATRDGTALLADVTLRYQVPPERVLEVHRSLGPHFESESLRRWTLDALRAGMSRASYAEVSGTRTEDLRASLSRDLTERCREAGLVLLSCEVGGVRILQGGVAAAPGQTAEQRPGGRVLFVGLDGADWNIIDPLVASGRLPTLARLAREGVRARLRTITPMLSPVIWTSIATGVVPARHGILDFVAATEREGERVPVTSTRRKVKAIWNVLSESGVKVGIVGWWATYPSEKVDGFIVSDRVAYQLFGARPAEEQARRGKVYPEAIDGVVQSLTVAPEAITDQDLRPFMRLPPDASGLPAAQSKMVDDFKTLLASTRTYLAATRALAARQPVDFTAVYLEGTDTVAHLFMPYAPPPLQGADPKARQRFSRSVDEYYGYVDGELGRLILDLRPDSIIVVSDHGFRTGENRPLTESRIGYGGAADWHRKYGILILHGPAFKRGASLDEASVLDVTPTILRLFDLPVGEDMDGRPITEAFDPGFLQRHPERYVPSWESGRRAEAREETGEETAVQGDTPDDAAEDAERIEKLRSLGYLAATGETANAHNNRGTILLGEGKYDEAIAEFEKALTASENPAIARLNIARAYYKKKDYAAATRALAEHMKSQPRSKEAENLLGNMAMDQGRLDAAEEHFRRALGYEPNFADARNSLGLLFQKRGRADEALEEFKRVVAVDPDYAEAHNNIGIILKDRGRKDEAVAAFRRAIQADPDFSGSYSNLALVLEDSGQFKEAEAQFRNALRRDPGNVAVRTNFGGLLYLMERYDEARQELERATALDPAYASAWNNLGAALGRLGRVDQEIAAYRKAAELDPGYADVHHNLGLALIKSGSAEAGEAEIRRALAIDPAFVPAYLNLARRLVELSRDSEAIDLLVEGTKKAPSNPDLPVLMGEIYLKLGRTSEAIASFEEALRLKPDQADLRQRLQSLRSAPSQAPDAGGNPGGETF